MATSARSAATGYRTYGMPPPYLTKMTSNLHHRLLLLIAVNVEIFIAWIECRPFLLGSFQPAGCSSGGHPPTQGSVTVGNDVGSEVTIVRRDNPAHDVRRRYSDEIAERLLEVRWRNCSDPDFETFLEETEKGKGRHLTSRHAC
jgi:hypothetical protein